MIELQLPSPIQKIESSILSDNNVKLFVKRDDLVHPHISGNKWRKLKGSLDTNPSGIITFGGPFSNHIYSTAAAGFYFNIPTIGIIRGDIDEDNPTIKACRKWNMALIPVSRSEYREKNNGETFKRVLEQYSDYMYVPEGGSSNLANVGLGELAKEIISNDFDYVALAAGTGGTVRGIASVLCQRQFLLISSLKGNDLVEEFGLATFSNVEIVSDYHHGGYGRVTPQLLEFINSFYKEHGIPLDPIYNGKVVFAIYDMVQKQLLSDCSILWIHTGGIQGVDGYNYLAHKKGKPIIEK